MRKPSTPRSSQNRITSSTASCTAAIVQVQLRLAGEEIVQVILPPPRVPRPCRAAEHRLPVATAASHRAWDRPRRTSRPWRCRGSTAFGKPCVFVRGVRIDLIDQHLEPQFVRPRHQCIEIGQRAEDRIDIAVIGHVVAEILHRAGEERADPDRIDAERGDMIEAAGDARQIADPVAVRVHEAARIDLIDRRALPPRQPPLLIRRTSLTRQTAQPKAGRVKAALPGAVTAAGQAPASVSNSRAAYSPTILAERASPVVLNTARYSVPSSGSKRAAANRPGSCS